MPNEFVARNGIIALNNSSITGSLGVSGGITGSLLGTASWASNAVTSSYVLNAVSASFASTASFVNPLLQNVLIGTTTDAGYKLDVNGTTRIQGAITLNNGQGNALIQQVGTQVYFPNANGIAGYGFSSPSNGVQTFKDNYVLGTALTSSAANDGVQTGYSFDTLYSLISGNKIAKFTTTGSLKAYIDYDGSIWSSGSGTFIKGLSVTGSLNAPSITGSLQGTASWANNVISASFATTASNALTASYILSAVSASFASTASSVNTLNQAVAISGSFTIVTGSGVEFQVTNTGTKIGNIATDTHTITGSMYQSGSTVALSLRGSGSGVFTVDGTSGRLFSVDDSLSGSLFSVNTAAGLPIIEAFSDNTVRIGQYGQRVLYVSQSRVGVGKETGLNGVLDVSGSVTVTGSLNVSGSITGSLLGTASLATTASNALTASYVLNAVSASFASTASFWSGSVTNATSASFATTSSYANNFTVAGTITAQTLVVQEITSSRDFVTGSTRFGSLLSNTHQFTGSVSMTGSLTTNGNTIVSGSLTVATSSNQGGVQLYSNSSVGGGIRFSHTNGSVIGRIELNAGGGTTGLDLYAYDYFNFKTLNTAINFITTTATNWYTYSGNKFNFVGYTGFGGEVIMKNNLDGTEVFHAYLADTYKVAFPTGSVSIGKPAATTPNATLDVSGSVTITGSLTVITGSAIELQVTNTGVKIGNAITDTHTVTGSINISGSVTATNFTGSLFGTASWATTATRVIGGTKDYVAVWDTGGVLTTGSVFNPSATGNVGINNLSPSYKVHISGSTAIYGGGLIVSGTLATSGSGSQGLVAPLKFTTPTLGSSYTLVYTDEGKIVEMNNNADAPLTLTIPLNSSVGFPIGTEISIIQIGSGTTIITGSAGVTINSSGGLKTLQNQYDVASIVKRGTDSWYLFGNLG